MNWARVKTILILIFISLNIFLLVNILGIRSGGSISKDVIDNTVEVLQNRGIKVTAQVPDYYVKFVKLNYELIDFNKMEVAKVLTGDTSITDQETKSNTLDKDGKRVEFLSDRSIRFEDTKASRLKNSDDRSVKEYLDKLLKGLGIPVKNYVRDSFINQKSETDIIYIEKYNEFFIYDNYIEVRIQKDKTTIKFMYNKINGLTNNQTAKESTPLYKILLTNFTKGCSYSAIEKIDAGFKILDEEKSAKKGAKNPVWRMKTDAADPYVYFNIYNGNKVFPINK